MSALPISGITRADSGYTSISTQIVRQPHTQSVATGSTQMDTATLSLTAKALRLYRDGESATAVAAVLGLNIATVDGYLNIPVQGIQTTRLPSST